MAKKKDEKDVLVVRDEKTGEISVVAGLNADGTPKRTPAKAENAQSFLQFDRHGDVLDNFFKNFFRQCKEPSRFGFYRIAADQAENLLEVMKQLLKDPEANKELLAPHKVDTSDYEKKVQEEMAAQQTEKQEPQKQENMEQRKEQQQDKSEQMQGKRGYQPIDESKINWQELEDRWGVKRDNLEKSGDLTKMLNYGKSDLVKVKPTFGGESFELDARLSFKKDGEGNISLVPHFIRKEQKLDEYKEHKFSDNDRKNLRETGNLGRVVDIVDRETGEIIPSYISIDRKTNEITDIPASRVRIPERIGKTEITTQERDTLKAANGNAVTAQGVDLPAQLRTTHLEAALQLPAGNGICLALVVKRKIFRKGFVDCHSSSFPEPLSRNRRQKERKKEGAAFPRPGIRPLAVIFFIHSVHSERTAFYMLL